MIKEQQESFYLKVGQRLTDAMKRKNMSVAQLAKASGEQGKTIRSIQAGNCHSFHHAVWMKSILGIDVNEIIEDKRGSNEQGKSNKSERTIDDLI